MSSLRVLLLGNAITPDRPGGLERYIRDLGTALARRGADVMIHARRVSPDDPQRSVDVDGVEIVRFPTPSKESRLYALGYPAATARAVLSVVRDQRLTRVLHSHFPLQGLPLAVGRSPYVHTFHAPVYRELVSERQGSYVLPGPTELAAVNLMRIAEIGVLRRAGDVVVLSEFMRTEAQELGAHPAQVSVLPGGIDTERFCPGPPIDHPWARAEGPLLFTARRLVPRTGVTELIEAFASIVRTVPAARLVVAGHGPLEDEIRGRIQALELQDLVLTVGWISDEELIGWYRAADLVVMPTQQLEGFGLTTAEALACGTPVVGTPVGANPEVLRRLDPSLVARDASPAAIAGAVGELLGHRDRLSALAARARSAVHPGLAWSSIADTHMSLYEPYQPSAPHDRRRQRTGYRPAHGPTPELIEILRSPNTGESLISDRSVLHTGSRAEAFPVIDHIPVLLASDSAFSADDYLTQPPASFGLVVRMKSLLRRAIPSLSHNLSAARNFAHFRDLLYAQNKDKPARVLVVGGAILGEGMESLMDDPAIRLVEADVAIGPRTDVICDAHSLPFAPDTFDGVVCQAVLEHVADPVRVVAEIHRVLKPGGFVYSEIPFMQQVHEGAYDFTRFTCNGHRRLFRYFEEIDVGATAGPGMALGWSIRSLVTALAGRRKSTRLLINGLTTLTLFWLKYLDGPLMRKDAVLDGASGIYFLGRSIEVPRSDRDIIAGYRGVNSGFAVRR